MSFLVVRSFGGNSSRREVNESVGLTVSMAEGSGKGVVTPNPPSHRYIELSSFIYLCLTQVNDRSPCCLSPNGPVRNPTHLPLCFLMQMRVIPLAIMESFLYITQMCISSLMHTHTLHTFMHIKITCFMHIKTIVTELNGGTYRMTFCMHITNGVVCKNLFSIVCTTADCVDRTIMNIHAGALICTSGLTN